MTELDPGIRQARLGEGKDCYLLEVEGPFTAEEDGCVELDTYNDEVVLHHATKLDNGNRIFSFRKRPFESTADFVGYIQSRAECMGAAVVHEIVAVEACDQSLFEAPSHINR